MLWQLGLKNLKVISSVSVSKKFLNEFNSYKCNDSVLDK